MEQTTTSPASLDSAATVQIRAHTRDTQGWLKFVGIAAIIIGALYALSLVGIIVAWIPIWLGVLMHQAGSKAADYADRANSADLVEYHSKLKTLFTIMGILMIIMLVLIVVGFIIGIIVAVAGGFAALNY
jgi:hypothetical protein